MELRGSQVKQNKPDKERQVSQVLSHTWKLELKEMNKQKDNLNVVEVLLGKGKGTRHRGKERDGKRG